MPFNWTKEKIIAPIPSENYKLIIYEQVDAFNKVLDSLEFEIIESSTSYFDYKFDSKIEMYPNPTSKYLTVVSKQLIDRIDIFDLTGRFILSTKELYIDFTAMENGQYIIKIHLSSGQEIGKIIFKNEY